MKPSQHRPPAGSGVSRRSAGSSDTHTAFVPHEGQNLCRVAKIIAVSVLCFIFLQAEQPQTQAVWRILLTLVYVCARARVCVYCYSWASVSLKVLSCMVME